MASRASPVALNSSTGEFKERLRRQCRNVMWFRIHSKGPRKFLSRHTSGARTSPLAVAVQSYGCEEWLHYALHFSNSRFPLFRRMKKYHLYHHSPRGIDKGYGITTRFWDGVFDTRFPEAVRRSLSKN